MTTTTKTIKMPATLADSWLAALRSGGYKQGRCRLMTEEFKGDKRYCCLGVLQMVADGAVERDSVAQYAKTVPSMDWLVAHDIMFFDSEGVQSNNPEIGGERASLAYINDFDNKSFAEIADLIERYLERV